MFDKVWREQLLQHARRSLEFLQGYQKSGGALSDLAGGRQAELHFVIKALEKSLR